MGHSMGLITPAPVDERVGEWLVYRAWHALGCDSGRVWITIIGWGTIEVSQTVRHKERISTVLVHDVSEGKLGALRLPMNS